MNSFWYDARTLLNTPNTSRTKLFVGLFWCADNRRGNSARENPVDSGSACMMLQRFVPVLLVLPFLSTMTFAQIPCSNVPVVMDDSTNTCPMQNGAGKCNKVMFVITGFHNVSNTGVHISSMSGPRVGRNTVGTECIIHTKKNYSTLRCREVMARHSYEEDYEVPLGSTGELDAVMIAVSARLIKVTVNKRSTFHPGSKSKSNGSTSNRQGNKVPYVVEAIIPVSSTSGFCSSSTIRYKANGPLYKVRNAGRFKAGKAGSGYMVSAYMSPF